MVTEVFTVSCVVVSPASLFEQDVKNKMPVQLIILMKLFTFIFINVYQL